MYDRDLRVSDVERSHVIDLLQRATGAGSLTLDEFSGRVDKALASTTRADLNVLLLDLPGLTHPDQRAAPATRRAGRAPAAHSGEAVAPGGGVELTATLGSLVRRGHWDVPARMDVRVTLGSVELDFTEAELPDEPVSIAFEMTAGSARLRVPAGSRVVHDGLRAVLGSVQDHRHDPAGAAPGPTFVLTGAVRAGSVEIRSARRRWSLSG